MTDRNYTCVADAVQPSKSKLTTSEFIKQAQLIHADKYLYHDVVYINTNTKVKIFCKSCNDYFWQIPKSHLKGMICRKCSFAVSREKKRLNQDFVIQQFKKVHGDKYFYDKVFFTSVDNKVIITCKQHGDFEQIVKVHRKGAGCPACSNCKRQTQDEILERFRKTHGDKFDYSLVEYKNIDTNVKIICKEHGIFEQTPYNHIKGNQCPQCSIKEHPNLQYTEHSKIISDFIKQHGDTYDYSKVIYKGAFSKVKIICREHGEFMQVANSHKLGRGCPKCADYHRHRHTRTSYIESCKNTNGNSSLYIIEMTSGDEIFYKIGITKLSTSERFRKLKAYNFKELFVLKGEAGFIFDLEKRLHKLLSDSKYEPLKYFEGHSECFSHIPKSVIKLLKDLENTPQLQLIA